MEEQDILEYKYKTYIYQPVRLVDLTAERRRWLDENTPNYRLGTYIIKFQTREDRMLYELTWHD